MRRIASTLVMLALAAGWSVVFLGVVGKSNDLATGPANEAITPSDVAASFFHNLGIDHTKEYHTPSGRPVMIVRNGKVLRKLFS